jgi:hypothetical protein
MNHTPEQLLALTERMSLIARIDNSAGYDVTRVIITKGSPYKYDEVFDPLHNAEQSMAVLCWLMATRSFDSISEFEIACSDSSIHRHKHDNTPPSLRAAILAAALRVVGEK